MCYCCRYLALKSFNLFKFLFIFLDLNPIICFLSSIHHKHTVFSIYLLKDLNFFFFINRCGYCNEELYTRYAATYHLKYKHPGEERYFIKDEQDVTKFYVNRANFNSNANSIASANASASKDANSSSSSASSISSNDENHHIGDNGNLFFLFLIKLFYFLKFF